MYRLPARCSLFCLFTWVIGLLAFFSVPTQAQVIPPDPPPSFAVEVGGQWGPVLLWPHVSVSMANLPDGRILTYASNEPNAWPDSRADEYTHAVVWDPKTGQFKDVPHPSHDMFCAAMVTLESGETFVMGGRNAGDSPWVSYFDFHQNQWIQFDASNQMNKGRWYPTAVYLGSGEVFIAAGVGGGKNPELYTPGSGWTLLTDIDLTDTILEFGTRDGGGSWPLLQLDKSGKIFHHGATTTMNTLDPFGGPAGLGSITDLGPHNFGWFPDEATSVLYDEGKILVAGGSTSTLSSISVASAYRIDINGPAPVLTPASDMNLPRQFQNEVVLPTGDVLVVGGNTNGLKFNDFFATLNPEVWDPATDTWTLWNPQQHARTYHSTALLLTDGRVLSSGGGMAGDPCPGGTPPVLPGECGRDHWNAEVFSPPYLFTAGGGLATRPQVIDAPKVLRVGRTFSVQATPGLSGFSMVRMSATTHTINTDQRFLRPSVVETAPGLYDVTLHSNPNVLVPGYWMLFALAGDVPSLAHVIQVVNDGKPRGPPISGLRNDLGDSVLYQVEAEDPDGNPLSFAAFGLPPGLSLDPATGIISGTTTQAGLFNVEVVALDGSDAANIAFQWVVSAETSESGTLLVSQSDATEWHTVDLSNNYDDPVVVMGPPSFNDAEPTTVRVRNVTSNSFEFQLEEWLYQDGVHASEEVSYLVVEAGEYLLAGGGALVAGITTGADFANPQTELFTSGVFSQTPLVLTQTATTLGAPDAPPVAPRLTGVTTTGFVLKLQEEEAGDQLFPAEDVHWIALEPAAIAGLLEADLTASTVDESPESVAYSQAFSSLPHLLASLQTTTSDDPAVLRHTNASTAGFDVFVEEETSFDAEVDHTDESVGWLAIDPAVTTLGLLPFFNEPPAVIQPADQMGYRGDEVSLFIQALDPEGGVPTFAAANLPPGLAIDPGTGEISGTLMTSGVYSPTVTVTDPSNDSGQTSFVWTVNEPLEALPFPAPPQVAGSVVEYTAQTNLPGGYEYDWNFDDGTPPVGLSGSPVISHLFAAPGRYRVTLTVTDPASSQSDELQFVQNITAQLTALPPTASTSILYETANDRVWAVNPDNDTVTLVDAISNTKLSEIQVSADPRTLAVAGDGRIWVACKDAAVIDIIDPTTLSVVQTIEFKDGSEPHAVVFNPTGTHAYVSLTATGKVLRLNGTTGAVLASKDVGPRPRQLAVTADGNTLWVARFVTPLLPNEASGVPAIQGGGGEVLQLDAFTLALGAPALLGVSTQPDTEQAARGVPNYLGAFAISPDGSHLLIPSKQDNVFRGGFRDLQELRHDSTVRAILSRVDLATGLEDAAARLDHDNASIASATLFSQTGAYAFTALEGNREVAVVDPFGHFELGRVTTGRAPQGLALSPDGLTLYVDDFMDRSVSVYDLTSLLEFDDTELPLLAVVPKVALEVLTPAVLNGKQLFYDAQDPRLAQESYMACAACHNDGGGDGRVWDFTDLGEGFRNTIGLQGRGLGHGPRHWTANFDEVQDFEGQIRHFGGLGLMSDPDFAATSDPLGAPKALLSVDLDDLAAYVDSLQTTGPSPLRASGGALTPDAVAGRAVFAAQGCGGCHEGAAFTDSASGMLHDVGTLKVTSGPQTGLDTPTLRHLWHTPPYLHDGSAPTLLDAVRAHAGVSLDPVDEAYLVAYLGQIDDTELLAPNGVPVVSISSPADSAVVSEGDPVNFAGSATDPEEGDLTASLSWTSDLDGALGSGASFVRSDLRAGTHVITSEALDAGSQPGSAQISLTVNGAPVVTITSPLDSTTVNLGASVDLVASANDMLDGDLTSGLAWSSDRDGPLGTGGNLSTSTLTAGVHVLSADVTDSGGLLGHGEVTLTVNDGPSVSITAPTSGTEVNLGAAVNLLGSASDPEQGDLTPSIAWSSDRDGALGTGGSVNTSSLSAGLHVLSADVVDGGGLAGHAEITLTVNGPPTVNITAPAGGSTVTLGALVGLAGSASDAESGDLTASIAWSSNVSGALGTGGSVNAGGLSVGAHVISADVTDAGGLAGHAEINLTVNDLPTVSITAPASGTTVNAGTAVNLTGSASDPEEGDLTSGVAWSSNLDGLLGTGGSVVTSSLTGGLHVLSADVTDSHGAAGHAEINLTVNAAPSVSISAPTQGSEFSELTLVSLIGSATDAEDGALTSSLAWSSNLDGALGTGGNVGTTTLSVGTHVLSADVTDSGGLPGHAEVTITIKPQNAPTVSISAPVNATTVNVGASVTLSGTAADVEDGDLTSSIEWSSNLDGALGSGGSVVTSALTVGVHVLSADVEDSVSLTGHAQVTLTVNAFPSASITAPLGGATLTAGVPVLLNGTASDTEDGDLTGAIAWSSDVNGALGVGGSVNASGLAVGPHVLSADVIDSSGAPAHTEIAVTVNALPVVEITAPAAGAEFGEGAIVTLTGSATDAEDGTLTSSIQWSSDRDGLLGSGGSLGSILTVGAHVLSADVTDAGGAMGHAEITLTINGAPSVTISAPASGITVNAGDSVNLQGSANDAEDGDLTSGIAWSSDVSGPLGGGGSVVTSSLAVGTHMLSAEVTDSGGLLGHAEITLYINAAPSVNIAAPTNGSQVNFGAQVDLIGSATDPEDGPLTASLSWSSDRDGALGSGGSVSTSNLTVGDHVLSADVTDSNGFAGHAEVALHVNGAPSVNVTAPANGSQVNLGASVNLQGSATDPEEGDLTASIAWSSSLDGALGTGGSVNTSALTAGSHVLSADVTDAGGLLGHAEVTLAVNAPPSVGITAPIDGAQFIQGTLVSPVGTATDAEDGNLAASIVWSSSLDGALGTGGSISTNSLRVGNHVLSADVTDSGGSQDQAQISVTILAPNMPPSVSITAPIFGSKFIQGAAVDLVGSASDPEDANLSAGISWSSSIDGLLGSGASVSPTGLSLGTHVIAADVTDSGGLPGHAQINITIHTPPVVSITSPLGGTTVNQGAPVNFVGTASDLEDGDLSAVIAWSSDLDGVIAIGANKTRNNLSPGAHVISADVTDSGGATSHAEVTLTVNAAPMVTITAPLEGGQLAKQSPTNLVATAMDPEDGDVGASVVWTSSVEGPLGSGATLSFTPQVEGLHAITASAADGSALSAFDQVVVFVPEPSVRLSLVAALALLGALRRRRARGDVG